MRALAPAALVLVLLAAGCGSGDGDSGTAASGDNCASVDAPAPREAEILQPPTEPLDPGTAYTLVIETSCGSFTVALDQELAPTTSASLVALARAGYFDDTIFHRVATGFVIQGGDPTQTGAGGPGYSTTDVPPPGSHYVRGVVAMAKTEFEPPGTAGSQFFVVTAEDTPLTADYAIVGTVTEGMDTVDRIDALGVGDGPPAQPVVVERVIVGEG